MESWEIRYVCMSKDDENTTCWSILTVHLCMIKKAAFSFQDLGLEAGRSCMNITEKQGGGEEGEKSQKRLMVHGLFKNTCVTWTLDLALPWIIHNAGIESPLARKIVLGYSPSHETGLPPNRADSTNAKNCTYSWAFASWLPISQP